MMAGPIRGETEKKHERRYNVLLDSKTSKNAAQVSASFLSIENGVAVFYNAENYIVRIFAAGTWREIERTD